MSNVINDNKISPTVLNHPAGLFVLFFTEMWERFSYYGMRALLVLFLISSVEKGGWAWSREDAGVLYAWYSSLVFFTPLIGGYIADRIIGARVAIVTGAILMILGHVSLVTNYSEVTFYLGLSLIVFGNGLFKPNISSIVGQLYTDENKKDSAYTIFYMGINAGAFLGVMLCGYVGEMIGWSYGFGLAGVFISFGLLQFYFSKTIFGTIGLAPKKVNVAKKEVKVEPKKTGLAKDEIDRLVAISVFAFFTIIFWWAFEQAGSSMSIFAKDYTQRILTGDSVTIFIVVNFFLTVVPVLIITWVLYLLVKQTFPIIPMSNTFLVLSFVCIWGVIIWKIVGEFSATDQIEVPASWFGILNSFFIIAFAPLVSKIWDSKFNPSGPVKFAIGLALLGVGFGFLAYGSMSIKSGVAEASVSMFWLIIAYFFHTMGELCLSPIGLSYVNKLAPQRFMSLMFGVWFFAQFIGNLFAGYTASSIDSLNEVMGLSGFFLLFTAIPIATGVIMLMLTKFLNKRMHGIH
ncbi:Di-/tripeptide transporter [Phocoenobacter uteri]|uniref:Di-/tripeptide transporter n=1 Tax=Phocoenobacter uteri TaxID=146806 RepID=A0A379CBP4_9PAST|nr:peptide MFS transporter [Phocoenobacter uteri]MDG6881678.1 peptide transporter [Phocoenobacter uteri]SUB59713.1 Di-/tripeptide transporter [Phocoenobacter uteri]